jgi:hypothetical protein
VPATSGCCAGPEGPACELNGLENELRLCCTPAQAPSKGAPRIRPTAVRRVAPDGLAFEGQGFEGQGFEGQGFVGKGFVGKDSGISLGFRGPIASLSLDLLTDQNRPGLPFRMIRKGGFRHIVGE